MLTIIYMAIMASASGGSFPYSNKLDRFSLTWLPEALFALPFGIVWVLDGHWIIGVLAAAWSYIWMQTGHGAVLHWGRNPELATGDRKQTLTPAVNFIADKLNIKIGSLDYCRLFMALKGFLIGLPLLPAAIVLAALWPLAYEIGSRLRDKDFVIAGRRIDTHMITELLSGAFAGIAIVMFVYGVNTGALNQ